MLLDLGNQRLPNGFVPVPLRVEEHEAALKVCLLATCDEGPAGFLLIRETFDTAVFLGCLLDKRNQVREWLEIWKQSRAWASNSVRRSAESLTNADFDRQWRGRWELLTKLDPGSTIEVSEETSLGTPIFINVQHARVEELTDAKSGQAFTLCRDEAALARARLPSYKASFERFLWTSGEAPAFLTTERRAEEIYGHADVNRIFSHLTPFNPDASPVSVRRLSPMTIDEMADLLGGKSWAGFRSGDVALTFGDRHGLCLDYDHLLASGAHFYGGRGPGEMRIVEVLHLKLNLLHQAFSLVYQTLSQSQLPFLNLRPESFGVRLSETGTGLPFLWTGNVTLTEPSCASAVALPGTETRFFIGETKPTVYQAGAEAALVRGYGAMRIRRLLKVRENLTSLEVTLASDEPLKLTEFELVHIALRIAGETRLDLYGRSAPGEALAQGETRLVTIGQAITADLAGKLTNIAGGELTRVQFEVLPFSSSPSDIYSLAMIAVRALLVDETNTLPVAIDELLSLTREMKNRYTENSPMLGRLLEIVHDDDRWAKSLGPQHLTREPALKDKASSSIPEELWWSVIGWLIRLIPGGGPDSYCQDFGAVSESALERIFEKPIAALRAVQSRTRSLLLADWVHNQEVRSAINELMEDALYVESIKGPAGA